MEISLKRKAQKGKQKKCEKLMIVRIDNNISANKISTTYYYEK